MNGVSYVAGSMVGDAVNSLENNYNGRDGSMNQTYVDKYDHYKGKGYDDAYAEKRAEGDYLTEGIALGVVDAAIPFAKSGVTAFRRYKRVDNALNRTKKLGSQQLNNITQSAPVQKVNEVGSNVFSEEFSNTVGDYTKTFAKNSVNSTIDGTMNHNVTQGAQNIRDKIHGDEDVNMLRNLGVPENFIQNAVTSGTITSLINKGKKHLEGQYSDN